MSHDFELGRNVSCDESTVSTARANLFSHDISKTDAARINKLDMEMVHHDYWTHVCFVVKGHSYEAQCESWRCCECWLFLVTYAARISEQH